MRTVVGFNGADLKYTFAFICPKKPHPHTIEHDANKKKHKGLATPDIF